MKITVELSKEQVAELEKHADKHKRSLPEDLLATWWGRVQALVRYEKKLADPNAVFIPHAPKRFIEVNRAAIKEMAVKQGIAPERVKTKTAKTTKIKKGRKS